MHRVAFKLKVKQDKLEEYKKVHQEVWEEMLEALREAGWHNYSLFVAESGLLFGYFETPHDFETARKLMAEKEVNTRWQEEMAPFFESSSDIGQHADEMMVELDEVFHLP